MLKSRKIIIELTLSFLIIVSYSYPSYDEYLRDFNKSYNWPQEILMRKQLYDSRIALFSLITDYTPGINNFTDWTEEQLKRLRISNVQEFSQLSQYNQQVQSKQYLRVSSSIPQSLDWRQKRAVTPVKIQGICGASWAFAVVAYIESKLIIQRQYPVRVDLSEQYLISCTPGSNCHGGNIDDGLRYAVNQGGLPYEVSFPYTPTGKVNPQICKTENKVNEVGSRMRKKTFITDEELIRLLQYGPVPTTISSTRWQSYSSGIFSCYEDLRMDHAALIVGYTNNSWIVKNQWGYDWGENGYIRITRSRNNQYASCGIGNFVAYLDPVTINEKVAWGQYMGQVMGLVVMVLMVVW